MRAPEDRDMWNSHLLYSHLCCPDDRQGYEAEMRGDENFSKDLSQQMLQKLKHENVASSSSDIFIIEHAQMYSKIIK